VAENRSLVMWEDLPEELRESYRDRARNLEEHLARVNCRMTPALSDHPEILRFTEQEIDVLARLEHERWCREKRRPSLETQERGFDTLSATRWDDCPTKVREFNRQMVAAMPLVLAKADFEVWREG